MNPICEAPGRAGNAATRVKSSSAEGSKLNTSNPRNAQELTACILGNLDLLAAEFKAVRTAADLGNFWGVISRLRIAREIWRALTTDAKALADVADNEPDWPDFLLPQAEIWLNVEPEFGLRGKSRRFLVGPSGPAAALAFFELLEARR
jgi:hypothetical protein